MCQAVCNDGSPGAFYFHKASDPAMANVWLVFLEGAQPASSSDARARALPLRTSLQPSLRFFE
jgi:hypothetical protein